jgi:hypothetical protein
VAAGHSVELDPARWQELFDAGARHTAAGEDLKRGSSIRRMRRWEQAAVG